MTEVSPDPRQIRLAEQYRGGWYDGIIEGVTDGNITLSIGSRTATYALLERSLTFAVGDPVAICPDWSVVRQGDEVLVILTAEDAPKPHFELQSALPAEAVEWDPATRAGWLYGYHQWLENEDWGDVSFFDLRGADGFESAAFEAYTEMHLSDSEDDDT